MNKLTIVFCIVALAAVAMAAEEGAAPSPSEYDVYNSNGDSNLEDSARPKRFLLLKKKLLVGKALALKKGKLALGAGAVVGGGALLAKKFHSAPHVTYVAAPVPAPVHYVSYDHGHHFDDHHFDHHVDHHYDHHDFHYPSYPAYYSHGHHGW